jgi:hypothetical protein
MLPSNSADRDTMTKVHQIQPVALESHDDMAAAIPSLAVPILRQLRRCSAHLIPWERSSQCKHQSSMVGAVETLATEVRGCSRFRGVHGISIGPLIGRIYRKAPLLRCFFSSWFGGSWCTLLQCHLHSQYRLKFRTPTNSHWTPGCGDDLHVLTAQWRSSRGKMDATVRVWDGLQLSGNKEPSLSKSVAMLDEVEYVICINASCLAWFKTRVAALCPYRGTLQRCQDLLMIASFKEGFALLELPRQPIHMQGTNVLPYNNAFTTTNSSRLELCPLERITL